MNMKKGNGLAGNCMSNMIGKQVYREFVYGSPRAFTFSEIREEVKKRGGLQYYEMGCTLGSKLMEAHREGELVSKGDGKFYPKSLASSSK